jgi:hypothetical protein
MHNICGCGVGAARGFGIIEQSRGISAQGDLATAEWFFYDQLEDAWCNEQGNGQFLKDLSIYFVMGPDGFKENRFFKKKHGSAIDISVSI